MKKSSLLLIPAALATGIALFYAWTDWSGARQLKAALAMLEAKHEPIRIEDFIPAPVPDARNVVATPIFREIFAEQAAWEKTKDRTVLPNPPETHWSKLRLLSLNPQIQKGESNLHAQARQLDPSFKGNESEAGEVILKAMAPSEPILAEVSEALQRPEVAWPLEYSKDLATQQLPRISLLLDLSKILKKHASAELAVGAGDDAFRDVQTLLAIAKASGHPPMLITELVEIAILKEASSIINEGLCRGSWSDSQLTSFSQSLGQIQIPHQLAKALRMERILTLQIQWPKNEALINSSLQNEKKTLLTASPEEILSYAAWSLRPAGWMNEDKSLCILSYQELMESLENEQTIRLPRDWSDNSSLINAPLWDRLRCPFTLLTRQVFSPTIQRVSQVQTLLNSLSAACAVERYHLAHHQLPSALDELVPTLLPSVPKDPMTGDPLHYKTSLDGSFVIYGLGWNRKDDGGPKVSSFNQKPEDQTNWGIVVQPSK